jgi:hypothetical protein
MVNYSNGKIYKIEAINAPDDEKVYVGSTTKQYLSQRMDTHRRGYKCYKNGKAGKVMSYELFDKYGIENCSIILIELVNANSKDELTSREKYYIQTMNSINKCITGRTQKEYREDNREKCKTIQREYYEKNKEYVLERNNKYKEDNEEKFKEYFKKYNFNRRDEMKVYKQEYHIRNKEEIKNKKIAYREQNKEDIKLKKKEYYVANKEAINAKRKELYRLQKEHTTK